MALIGTGKPTRCSLCDDLIDDEDAVFATRGVFFDPAEPNSLARHCDAEMHWSCYASWPERRRFAARYVEALIASADDAANRQWHEVWRDDVAFCTVNAVDFIAEVRIVLVETGSIHRVALDHYEQWLERELREVDIYHDIEREPMHEIRRRLRASRPSRDTLLSLTSGSTMN